MKRTSTVLDVLFVILVLFIVTVTFVDQSQGQAGKHAAVRAPNPMGFNNYGQYVAAKQVSNNLNISADTLRTEMVDNRLSLGDAIKKLRPELNGSTVRSEVKKAEAAAKRAEAESKLLEPIEYLTPRLSN